MTPQCQALLAPLFESGSHPSLRPLTLRPLIMGVLNVTPDSFSDGGKYRDHDNAVAHGLQLLSNGADIVDIGGESTRPSGKTYGDGAIHISEAEEVDRILPVIRSLVARVPNVVISIDTTKSVVARLAIQAGASIINDVSAGTTDDRMFAAARDCSAPIILMHGYGPEFSRSSIEEYAYTNVVLDVLHYLETRIAAAKAVGVKDIVCDVGIGFAKTYSDNMRLIKEHRAFVELGVPMALGVSRKSSIGKAMGRDVAPEERMSASLAAACYGALNGASIIRTHDVRETRDAMNVLRSIQN